MRSVCSGSRERRVAESRANLWLFSSTFFWICKSMTLKWHWFSKYSTSTYSKLYSTLLIVSERVWNSNPSRSLSMNAIEIVLRFTWIVKAKQILEKTNKKNETYMFNYHLLHICLREKSTLEPDQLCQCIIVGSSFYFETIAEINGEFAVSLQYWTYFIIWNLVEELRSKYSHH